MRLRANDAAYFPEALAAPADLEINRRMSAFRGVINA